MVNSSPYNSLGTSFLYFNKESRTLKVLCVTVIRKNLIKGQDSNILAWMDMYFFLLFAKVTVFTFLQLITEDLFSCVLAPKKLVPPDSLKVLIWPDLLTINLQIHVLRFIKIHKKPAISLTSLYTLMMVIKPAIPCKHAFN